MVLTADLFGKMIQFIGTNLVIGALELVHVVAGECPAHVLVLVGAVAAVVAAVAEVGVAHAEVVAALKFVLGAVRPVVEPRRAAGLIGQVCK